MINVRLCKSSKAAKAAANDMSRVVAIETEYGDHSLDESHPSVDIALNHHGKFQLNEAPALSYARFRDQKPFDNFVVSHIDLDVLFGLLWAGGWLKETQLTIDLSRLVAEADVNGFHTIQAKFDTLEENLKNKYLAIGYLVNSWIINDDGLLSKDISREVHKLLLKIKDIIIGRVEEDQLNKIDAWFEQQNTTAKLYLKNIVDIGEGQMFLYRAPFSLTTAYILNENKADIILQYNEQSRSLTLGCFDEATAKKYFGSQGVIEPLQKFFDVSAGGKISIGGSPRDIDLQPEVLEAFASFLRREYFNVPDIKPIA